MDPNLARMLVFLGGFALATLPKAVGVMRGESKPDNVGAWFVLGLVGGMVALAISFKLIPQ